MHPEGRTRYAKRYWQNGDSAYRWEWDYFYKDHLGNIRTTVTEQRDTARYIGHAENVSQQNMVFYTNAFPGRQSKASVPGMPTNSDPNSAFSFRLSQYLGGAIVGSGYACQKVMAGDSVDMKSEYWYLPNAAATTLSAMPEGYNANLFSTVSSRSSFRYASTLSSHGASVAAAPPVGGLNFAVAALLQMATNNYTNPGNNPIPKCYLNWLLLDEQLNYVEGSGGIMQIGTANPNAWQLLVKNGLVMPKSGYFISYYTNETDVTIYLDNIVLSHRSGPLLQESDTYAFGGGIDALESRSFGRAENKYGYNGKEKQPDLGLEWYDFNARFNDVQIGRWTTIDPLAEKFSNWSTYVSMGDNPVLNKDPDGKKFVNFDSEGNYTGTTKDNKWHNFWHGSRGRVQNAEGKTEIKFNFSDAKNDVADIQSGKIKRIEFVKDGDIDKMMQKAGVFSPSRKSALLGVENVKYAWKEAIGGGKLDFSYSGIPEAYPEASRDPLNPDVPPTPMLFLVKSKFAGGKFGTAYNHMNYGNFLTGAALEALGFPESAALVGGQWNSLFGNKNGYPSQFDSSDDQNAISGGWNYGMLSGYRSRTIKTKIIVGPLE